MASETPPPPPPPPTPPHRPARKRPGRLWLLFYGRRRRGFPGLLVFLLAAVVVLALAFGLPHGADLSRYLFPVTIGVLVLLIAASLGLVVLGLIRPPRRRGAPRGRR